MSINIITNELDHDQREVIHGLHQQACYVMIKSGELKQEDLAFEKDLKPTAEKKFSMSQKLRFAIEEQRRSKKIDVDSEEYYTQKMQSIIAWINKS